LIRKRTCRSSQPRGSALRSSARSTKKVRKPDCIAIPSSVTKRRGRSTPASANDSRRVSPRYRQASRHQETRQGVGENQPVKRKIPRDRPTLSYRSGLRRKEGFGYPPELALGKKPGSWLSHPGVYCLRTNELEWDEETLWQTYTMMTDLEAVFRS